jgi:hypothetical protein
MQSTLAQRPEAVEHIVRVRVDPPCERTKFSAWNGYNLRRKSTQNLNPVHVLQHV